MNPIIFKFIIFDIQQNRVISTLGIFSRFKQLGTVILKYLRHKAKVIDYLIVVKCILKDRGRQLLLLLTMDVYIDKLAIFNADYI